MAPVGKPGVHVGLFFPVPEDIADQFPEKEQDKSNPHVTFLYVGEVETSREQELVELVSDFFLELPAIRASLGPMDYFLTPTQKVVFSSVRFSHDISSIRDQIREALLKAGFRVKDASPIRWHPHVTIAYVSPEENLKLAPPKGSWDIETVRVWGFSKEHTILFGGAGRRPTFKSMSHRVAAKYKSKKDVKGPDGKTHTIYEYSDQHNANKDKDKSKRVEKLRQSLSKLRSKYRKGLSAEDARERLTALAVALVDCTYERVGNDGSAKEGHFGVTGWQKKHVTISGNTATFKYTGKSGIDHEKKVTNSKVVGALKKALEGKKPGDKILCDGDECVISATQVNQYLSEFGVTAKDIRGLHANEEMKKSLSAIRKKGPKLPSDKKEREKLLKDEFKQALESAAEAVGHTTSILRSSYLVPGLEDKFMQDGTVINKLNKAGRTKTAAFDILRHCPHCLGIVSDLAKFWDTCTDCGYEVNLGGFYNGRGDAPHGGKPVERMAREDAWQPIPETDPRLIKQALDTFSQYSRGPMMWIGEETRLATLEELAQYLERVGAPIPAVPHTKTAAGNQEVIEAPHNFHRVKVEPPRAKRKVYPFEGYIDFQGIQIDVENKKGSSRSGADPDGNKWSIKMHAHYGEIRGTEGTDGDKLDVYVGENHDSSVVVVVHQQDPSTGKFDEDKVLLGFDSPEEAIGLYKKQYDKPGFFKEGEFLTMPIGQFWRWVNDRKNKGKKVKARYWRPLSDAVGLKTAKKGSWQERYWKTAIIHLWNATDGEGDLRGNPGLQSSLTLYERALIQELLIHEQPILRTGEHYHVRDHRLDPEAVGELIGAGYLEELEDGSVVVSPMYHAKARLYGGGLTLKEQIMAYELGYDHTKSAARHGPPTQVGLSSVLKRKGLEPVDIWFGQVRPHRRPTVTKLEALRTRAGDIVYFAGMDGKGEPVVGRTEREAKELANEIVKLRLRHQTPTIHST